MRVITTVNVLSNGHPIVSDLPVMGGKVIIDETAQFRRTLQNLEVIDPTGSLIPYRSGDALSPYGNELQIFNGLILDDGTIDIHPVGVFGISAPEVVDKDGVSVIITAYDRSRRIRRNTWDTPYKVPAGTLVTDAASLIAADRMPGVTVIVLDSTLDVTPLLLFTEGGDPFTDIQTTLAPAGFEALFNAAGDLVIRMTPQPSSLGPVAASYVDGENSQVSQVTTALTDDPGINNVVVLVESSAIAAPIRAISADTDPSSPTNVSSEYGRVTRVIRTTTALTLGQAQTMADTERMRSSGGTEQLQITAINDSAREAGDLLYVSRGSVAGNYIASNISLDLGLGDMVINTRKQRLG